MAGAIKLIINLLILSLLGGNSITLDKILTLNEDSTLDFTFSYDAVFFRDRLYVADNSYALLIFDRKGVLKRRIGKKGQGPKDFTMPPEQIEVVGDQLYVQEIQGWTLHVYSLKGELLRKEKKHPRIFKNRGVSYEKLPTMNQPCNGFRFQNLENHCLFGDTLCGSNRDLHLSTAFLISDKDRTFVIKRRGAIEIYEGCNLKKNIEIPLEKFKEEIIEDSLGMSLAKALEPGTNQKKYRFGLPVISAAVENKKFLWLLIGDEHSQDKYRHATETTLYRINLDSGAIDYEIDFQKSIDHVQVQGDYLTLNSADDGEVTVFLINHDE